MPPAPSRRTEEPAGTSSAWWTGDEQESLQGAVNLADQSAARAGQPWTAIQAWPELDDGHEVHAPVHGFEPNPFGLHNVPGNVWEWCQDCYDVSFYERGPRTDPVCDLPAEHSRVHRGGSFFNTSLMARSAFRGNSPEEFADVSVGLRPTRALTAP